MEINEMLINAKRLVELLEDPHPGLYTWQLAVHNRIAKINGEEE